MLSSRSRILIVEDDTALLEGIRDILELAGYEVLTAGNGLEGLDVLQNQTPDVIVSDIMMPRMNGLEFFEAVRGQPRWLAIPFIFLTAKGEKVDVRLGKRLGADDYVTKPFEEEDLLVAIGSQLKRRAALRSAQEFEMSQLRRTILTTLNHEFRTPLTYVTAYADMLQDDGSELSKDQFRDFLHGIQSGSDRLRRLVEDFIFLVELETGEAQKMYDRRHQRLRWLGELVREAVRRFQETAAVRGVTLRAEVAPDLPVVDADVEFMRNALGRLLDNACKFSKPGGNPVLVSVQTVGPMPDHPAQVLIKVHDEGIGIAPEELSRIFNVFYQIDRAKLEQQGSGSGLAIARGIAALHGGQIEVESRLGVGSTFTLILPVAPDEGGVR